MGRLSDAMELGELVLAKARETRRYAHEATALALIASIHRLRGNAGEAMSAAEMAANIARQRGLPRILAAAQALMADLHRAAGNIERPRNMQGLRLPRLKRAAI